MSPSAGYRLATFTDNSTDKKASISGNIYSISNVSANHIIAATFELTPDSILPTVSITAPTNGASGNVLWQIDGTASDNSSVSKVEIQIYNGIRYVSATGQFSTTAAWIPATTNNNWQTWSLDTSNFSMNSVDGTYTITARSTDSSNNVSTPAVVSFNRGSGNGSGTTTLNVAKSEAAAGLLTSNPAGINCDTTCSATGSSYTNGTIVTITAVPATGYYFLNWSNCDSQNSNVCTETVTTNNLTVTANFSAKKATLLTVTAPQTQKLTLNAPLTINGMLATNPTGASSDLNNQDITITVKPLTGTIATHTAKTTDNNGAWQIVLNDFSSVDTYIVEISYAGSGKLLTATAQPLNVLVGKSAGYAIVIQGKTNDNVQLNDHRYSAEDIIAKLKSRSFLDEDIKALYSDETTAVTRQQIQEAIVTWAKDKMIASPAPLYIIMVDHGTVGQFHIGSEVITPSDLKTWLGTLETNLSPQAKTEKRIVIIGACYSGSFIKDVSGQGRIVITSAGEDERSIGGDPRPWKNSIVFSGELFLEELFSYLTTGNNFSYSFATARDNMADKNPRRLQEDEFHYGRRDKLMQHPLLDDNGDGIGEYSLISDGALVASLTMGYGNVRTNGSDNPAYVDQTAPTTYLTTKETNGLLWLTANNNSAIDYAFVSIRKPDSTTTSTGIGQVILNFDKKDLIFNTTSNRWEYTYTGFDQSGTYELFYYTREKATGFISPTVKRYIYKAKDNNTAPTQFNLLAPNGTQESTYVGLIWEESSDTDGLTYTVQVSRDSTFATIDYQKEGITDSFTDVPNDKLKENPNGTLWYWQVIATDTYGSKQLSNQKYSFNTSNTNALPGIIKGYLYSDSGIPIAGASMSTGAQSFSTLPNGGFLIMTTPGSYTVTATATGYQQKSVMVTAIAGKVVSSDVSLQPNATTKQDSSITVTIPTPATAVYNSQFTVAATASSGLAVSYSSGTPTICTNNGATFTMIAGSGTCTVQYDQGGNGSYNAAPQKTSSTSASPASQTITFTPPSSKTYGDSPMTITVSGGASGNPVTFLVTSGPGTLSGTNNSTLTITGVGTIVVKASQAGNSNYAAATDVTASIVVNNSSYTVTGSASGNGSIQCVTPVTSGDATTCTLTPDTGYRISAASGCGSGSLSGTTYTTGAITGSCTVTATFTAVVSYKPGDCDSNGTVTIAEVQSSINMFLGLKTVEACVDIDSSGSVSIAEVQKVINSFLGL